jgi:hypothetical protein
MLKLIEGDGPSGTQGGARDLLLRRAHGVLDRFDRVGETMQRVADMQVGIMEKLSPIVDNLGELVKLTLDETRERLGQTKATQRTIDHPVVETPKRSSKR